MSSAIVCDECGRTRRAVDGTSWLTVTHARGEHRVSEHDVCSIQCATTLLRSPNIQAEWNEG